MHFVCLKHTFILDKLMRILVEWVLKGGPIGQGH